MKSTDISYSHDKPSRGGQHVGVSTGIRATHIPTGKTVFVDSERSQHANQRLATERLVQLIEGEPPVVEMTAADCQHSYLPSGGSFTCVDCGEYQSLGSSNDDAPGVAIEIRAAAIDRQPEGSGETLGWIAYVTDSPCGDFDDATSAGYLAAAIEHHDEEQGQ